ncbi:Six-hairpin glycosidase-like protein [Aspergillus germanicus]
MMTRTDTHDMGFIIQPSLRKDWELTSNPDSLNSVLTAARSLASRYVPSAGAIRSWDILRQADVEISSLTDDCLVIIDSMMNLDLLFYASSHLSDPSLADIATTHARTVIRSLLRPEESESRYPLYSTYHVVNFDPHTGGIKQHRTAQGYRVDSTWARGQAWAIHGFAQTYNWTKESEFLTTACGLADYFLQRLETSPACVERPITGEKRTIGRYVPLWDFDAPIEGEALRDSSAGVIAANGLLLLSQSLTMAGDAKLARKYFDAAVRIVTDTIEFSYSQERARLVVVGDEVSVEDVVAGQRFDAVLKNATANHNAQDHDRYSDHGLVYADYYLLEFGNQLLRMGLV